jgi:hypothetical protein
VQSGRAGVEDAALGKCMVTQKPQAPRPTVVI